MKKTNQIQIDKIAAKFGEYLTTAIGTVGYKKTVKLNRAEPDRHICHSHDFCDANDVMIEAFTIVMGREPECGTTPECEADMETINAAWSTWKSLTNAHAEFPLAVVTPEQAAAILLQREVVEEFVNDDTRTQDSRDAEMVKLGKLIPQGTAAALCKKGHTKYLFVELSGFAEDLHEVAMRRVA